MARSAGSRLVRVLLVLVGIVLLLAGYFMVSVPRADGRRVEVKLNVVGVTSPDMYAWIIRTKNGAVLVDTGLDPEGKAILEELKKQGLTAEDVHTVLLTHGHVDHTSAASVFTKAKVYVGKEDIPLVTGEDKGTGLGALFAKMSGPRAVPKQLMPLEGGETLDLDGEQVKVIAVPGHTDGSRMYLYDDVLFTGDSLQGGDKRLSLAPSFFSKDVARNRKSLEALKDLPFTLIADGHTGATANAREKLKRLLAN